MTFEVQDFIERNSRFLDTDTHKFFVRALSHLTSKAFEELVSVFKDAKIDIQNTLEKLLTTRLSFQFSVVPNNMALQVFVGDELIRASCSTFVGMNKRELMDYILDNEHLWQDDIYFEVDSFGIIRIRRV